MFLKNVAFNMSVSYRCSDGNLFYCIAGFISDDETHGEDMFLSAVFRPYVVKIDQSCLQM